ncbi:MAG: O-methyltransferase [Thaumarchaeota archaeon]|nr:O-methyltransferase [Nitrososphaerota archaeon]
MNEKILSVLERLEGQERFEQENLDSVPHSERMLAITPKIGKFYNILLRTAKATKILEIGTSVGYSTIWFAEALQELSGSKIITIDSDAKKIQRAKKNFEEAGVMDIIEQRQGNALDILSQLASQTRSKFDFVFIDADKENYVQYFDAAFPLLKVGGLIGADNILLPARYNHMISLYLNHVKNNPKVLSETIPIDNGEELTLKLQD